VRIGVIAPHGDLAIAEACDEHTSSLATRTQAAMALMAARAGAARPDVAVVATPHNVHDGGHMAVLTSSEVAGRLEEVASPIELSCRVDRDLALGMVEAMNAAGAPTVGISFGGNDPAEAASPMDWGVLVPMWHLVRCVPDLPVVVVAPARELDAVTHVAAGAAIARAARDLGRRVVFVASADQGHGHSAEGSYGFHPESAAFDAKVREIVERGAMGELVEIPEPEVRAALADSWWQMLMLHGGLQEDGRVFAAELLAYEAPTYYGMLTAVFEPSG
jgi:aromatic ring-opening dioxygenase LigB subunit